MPTEDTDIEAGGQTEDSDTGDTEEGGQTDDSPAAAADADKPPGTRDKRRANRFKEEKEGRERAERELAELRNRHSGLENQFNEMRQQLENDRRAAQQSDASKQTSDEIRSIREQARTFLLRSAQSKDPTEAQKFLDRHDELMDKADDMRAEMREEARLNKKMGEFSSNIPNPSVQREIAYLEGKFPQVAENEEAMALAAARFKTLTGKNGMPSNRQTMEAAITWAMAKLGIGGRSAPSDSSRRVYEGRGQRDGEHDEGGTGSGITADDVKNNIALRKMAENVFRQDEAPIAYAKFAKMYNAEQKRNGVAG